MIQTIRNALWLFFLLAAFTPLAHADAIKVENANGDKVFKIGYEGGVVRIKDGSGYTLLEGKPREDGGREYKRPSGVTFAKVKDGDGGFKLKGEGGELMWKVKFYGNRMEVGRDEALAHPELLRKSADDQWDMERDGAGYGKVKFYPEKGRTKAKDASNAERFRIDGGRFSPAVGVLMIPGILRDDAYVLMAEIWLRGW